MKQKFQNFSSTNLRYNWMRKILHADQRQKQKPQRREPAGSSTRTVPIGRRTWTDIEPGKYSFSDYEVSKKVTYLLRHSQKKVHREEDGAVHFWRIKENLQKHFPQDKRRFQYRTDASGTIVFSELFRDIQDAILLILHHRTM